MKAALTGKNLWHLFSGLLKLHTFLAGGLWCSDLGSIPGFEGDVEGSKFHGVFISCWHVSNELPSDVAWQIFGEGGDGFAIGTSPDKLEAMARSFGSELLSARVGSVSYVPAGQMITDPAFQVRETHIQEEEVRFALSVLGSYQSEEALKGRVRTIVPSHCSGRNYPRPINSLILSEVDDSDFGVIVPIDPVNLFEEFLVGPKVPQAATEEVKQQLRDAGIRCEVRQLTTDAN